MSKEASKLSRYIKAPIRALCRARDFYVRSMTGCAGRVQYSGTSSATAPGMPRSFSVHSAAAEEDLRELIRMASKRAAAVSGGDGAGAGVAGVPRSQSVAVGRIDEDSPCDFDGDGGVVGSNLLFPRSRTVPANSRKGVRSGGRLVAG